MEEERVISSTNLGPTPKATPQTIKTEICPVPQGNRLLKRPMGLRVGGQGWGKWEEPDLDSRTPDYKEASGNHAHRGAEPRGRR